MQDRAGDDSDRGSTGRWSMWRGDGGCACRSQVDRVLTLGSIPCRCRIGPVLNPCRSRIDHRLRVERSPIDPGPTRVNLDRSGSFPNRPRVDPNGPVLTRDGFGFDHPDRHRLAPSRIDRRPGVGRGAMWGDSGSTPGRSASIPGRSGSNADCWSTSLRSRIEP